MNLCSVPTFHYDMPFENERICLECCAQCKLNAHLRLPMYQTQVTCLGKCFSDDCMTCSPIVCISCKQRGIVNSFSCSTFTTNYDYFIYLCNNCRLMSPRTRADVMINLLFNEQVVYQENLLNLFKKNTNLPLDLQNIIFSLVGIFNFKDYKINGSKKNIYK